MHGKRKRLILAALCAVLCLALVTGVYAWFVESRREVFASYLNIESPPIINILNGENEDTMVINLEGVQLQQDQYVVFCCAPAEADSALSSGFALELAYTTNMGEIIDLSALSYYGTTPPPSGTGYTQWTSPSGTTRYYKIEAALTAAANNSTTKQAAAYTDANWDIQECNLVNYKFYLNAGNNASFLFFVDDEDTVAPPSEQNVDEQALYNEDQVRFFALHITWPTQNSNINIDDRETDLVYVTAKGNILGG